MPEEKIVLFVCLHGSAKSLIAMEYFNRLAARRGSTLRAVSAGTEPDDEIPPPVVAGLAADGYDVRGRTPLRVTAALVGKAVTIVSFGPKLGDLVRGGVPVQHWDDMPAVSDDYAIARDAIRARVEGFFVSQTER